MTDPLLVELEDDAGALAHLVTFAKARGLSSVPGLASRVGSVTVAIRSVLDSISRSVGKRATGPVTKSLPDVSRAIEYAARMGDRIGTRRVASDTDDSLPACPHNDSSHDSVSCTAHLREKGFLSKFAARTVILSAPDGTIAKTLQPQRVPVRR